MKEWHAGIMFVILLGAFAMMIYVMVTSPSPARCWVTPDAVPRLMRVAVVPQDGRPLVCGSFREDANDAFYPVCWQMTEVRGKGCEGK
jgi:hypothetical protein